MIAPAPDFLPHVFCYRWDNNLILLHAGSDAIIFLAYFTIPLSLAYLVKKRNDIPFNWVFLAFACFIVFCGLTHFMEIWTLWHPDYWLSGIIKAFTAVASIATAFAMIPVVPKAIEIPSAAKLIQANEALRLQEDSLRDLTGRLLTVQDEERRRLARELHDSMGQDLAAVKMLVERSAEQLDGQASPIAQQLKDAVASCDAAIQQVRTISHLLHPPMLDELGLSATLSWYVDGLVKRKLLDVQLVTSGIDTRLRHEVETAIFRITQECLTNVIRHSGSTSAIVKLARFDKDVVLTVSDHGKGIPPDKQAQMLEGGAIGVGLRGMRERVRQLGGSLAIESGMGGTHIIARFPANQAVLATDASS